MTDLGPAHGAGDDRMLEIAKMQMELLWGDYLEILNQSRHIETVRINLVNFVLLLSSALTALITFDKEVNLTDLVPSLMMCVVGIFATGFSLAYLTRYDRNKRRAAIVRAEIDRRFFADADLGVGLAALRAGADETSPSRYDERAARTYYKILSTAEKVTGTSHLFWVVMPIFVSLVGITLTALAVIGVSAGAE